MNSLRQLARYPVKTLLGTALIIIACALLCISQVLYYASVLTQSFVEENYITIALPTSKFQIQELDEEGNAAEHTVWLDQPWEIQKFLLDLPARFPQAVKSVEQHDFISGYCSGTELLNYTQIFPQSVGNALTGIDTKPYTCAMFAITINDVSEIQPAVDEALVLPGINPDDYGVVANVSGTILEVYALQSGYESPVGRTIRLEVRAESEEALSGLGLETGQRYLIYGTNYWDQNWSVKCWISKDQNFYNHISWDNVVPLTEEEKKSFINDEDSYDEGSLEAKYVDEADGEILFTMSQTELDMINSCRLTVYTDPNVIMGYLTQKDIQLLSGEGESIISAQEYGRRYRRAGIIRLDSSAADFLEAPDNQIWQTALRAAEINNHAFPIIATDNLQSIAQFGVQEAILSDGRRFSAEEYEQGKPVCVISDSLAAYNGLSVGDYISIQYYEQDKNAPDPIFLQNANPSAYFYSDYEGFCSEEIRYEIVGLYRQKQEWTTDEYSFTPNTIFVPKQSVCGETETLSGGIFRTFVLKNGMTEILEEELTALEYDGLLAYYDQGYSDIADSLSAYFAVAQKILLVGLAGWCALIAVFLFLFPGRQKQAVERMWTLGAPRFWAVKHILASGMGIVIPGVVFGGVVSACLMQELLAKAGEYAGISLEQSGVLPAVAGLALVQLAVLAGLTVIVAGRITSSFYKISKR